jgi:hypothetical protein
MRNHLSRGEEAEMRYHALRLGDLQAMTPGERDSVLSQIAADAVAPTNGQLAVVNSRIRAFETRYEMSSTELLARLAKSEIRETADIASWLFLLQMREHSGRKATRSQQT